MAKNGEIQNQNILTPLILLLALLHISNAFAFPSITSITPSQVTVGKQQQITLKVNDWGPEIQLAIKPGGPYLKHAVTLEGDAHDIAIIEHYAYVTTAKHGLLIFDITGANEPILIGHMNIGKKLTKIVIAGQQAWLADDAYIYSMDIRQPEDPALLAKFPVNASVTDLFTTKDRVYVLLDQKNLLVLDAGSPEIPIKLAALQLKHRAQNFYVDQGYLYLAGEQEGVIAFDVTDETMIKLSGQYRTTGPALDVLVSNGYAYVATGIGNGNGGLTILDVTEPEHIRWVGSHQQVGHVDKVMAMGEKILLANDESKLILMDTDVPAMPSIHSIYKAPGSLHGFWPQQNTVYAITTNELSAIDFTATPPALSNEGLDFGQGVNFGGERRVFIRDNIAYVADWFSGIHLYDISKPAKPKLLSSYHTAGSPKGIVIRDDYAYVADDDHGLQILDIKDPRNPTFVSSLLTPGLAYTPILDGDKLFLASHRGGFQIIDITDAQHPRLISSTDTPGKSWSIQVSNNIAYIADDDDGLLIFDISTPEQPALIGQFNPGGNAEDVLIDNDLAYVAFFDRGLFVLDIKDPANPVQLGHIMTPGNARGLELNTQKRKDKLVYVADWLSGIQVVDVSDPANPHIIGSYDTEGAAWGVRIKGHHAFVADWWGGFTVLDVSNPEQPKFAGGYHATGKVMQTAVKGDYIYAANGAGGLQIFDIENPLNPTWVTGVDLNGNATALTIEDDRAYLTLDNNSTAVIDISNPFTAKQIAKIKRPQPRIAKPVTAPHITTHNGVQYVSGGKTIIAKKLLPESEVKKLDDNTLSLSLPDDLPAGAYNIELSDTQDIISIIHNAFEITLPAFGKPAFTMEDLKEKLKSMGNTASPLE